MSAVLPDDAVLCILDSLPLHSHKAWYRGVFKVGAQQLLGRPVGLFSPHAESACTNSNHQIGLLPVCAQAAKQQQAYPK